MEPTFAPTSVRITFPAVYETSDDVPRGKIFVHEPEHEHKERRGHPSELPYEQGIRAELLKNPVAAKTWESNANKIAYVRATSMKVNLF